MIRSNASRAASLLEKLQQLLPEQLRTVECLVERLLTTYPSSSAHRSNGHEMSRVLSQLASLGGTDIHDPVAWQQEVRQERDLFEHQV